MLKKVNSKQAYMFFTTSLREVIFFFNFQAYYKWLKHTREASQDINEKVKQGYRYLKTIWHEGVAVTNALKRTYDSYKVSMDINV